MESTLDLEVRGSILIQPLMTWMALGNKHPSPWLSFLSCKIRDWTRWSLRSLTPPHSSMPMVCFFDLFCFVPVGLYSLSQRGEKVPCPWIINYCYHYLSSDPSEDGQDIEPKSPQKNNMLPCSPTPTPGYWLCFQPSPRSQYPKNDPAIHTTCRQTATYKAGKPA